MIRLVEVGFKRGVRDAAGENRAREIRDFLKIPVRGVVTRKLYYINAEMTHGQAELAAAELFCDPVIEEYRVNGKLSCEEFDYCITVGFKPGVTDNVGKSAAAALKEMLAIECRGDRGVATATRYLLSGVNRGEAERIAGELLANSLIEDTEILSFQQWLDSEPSAMSKAAAATDMTEARSTAAQDQKPQLIDLEKGDAELLKISRDRTLALNLHEMKAIRNYFRQEEVQVQRRGVGLEARPTDVELEAIAQTWSEHCHHKVFNGIIHYTDEHGKKKTINSLFDTYIRRVTGELDTPWLLSVFKDNAGIIRFNDRLALVYKVETHNSPSALDPYGGAMTGIVGVNRDPLGTGMGARLTANVWGYCLGNPLAAEAISPRLLHPHRIREGVHRGVIEGGNQSGIPYMRGWELFDRRFAGKPLVFCGTLGEMPLEIAGIPCEQKEVRTGDIMVMVGGRVGKDGIHGATFSSEELHEASPVQAVQIGDPITQKKMADMLLEARDRLLYRAITDNGAGGLSSSVGEMALLSGGCEMDLAGVPLKYQGLKAWEILISEAQERMTLAVAPEKLESYLSLSEKRRVESTPLGRFTDSGKFHIRYGESTVAYLDMEFLHRGDPQYELEAQYIKKDFEEPEVDISDHGQVLRLMLQRLNICSKEEKARQYDHEVKGRSVIKPFAGCDFDVPSDATVMLAELGQPGAAGLMGIVLAEGINPFYSDIDPYWMAASVVDEAVRRVVAIGGDPGYIAALDNFCWPNVVKENMPERSHKLAQLVRANQGLYDFCKSYRLPLISGKDSMSNDCTLTDPPISIPPTLLLSVVSRISDVSRAVTLDLKNPGDLVYILGETMEEMGGSEFYRFYGEQNRGRPYIGNGVPRVKPEAARKLYRLLAGAMAGRLVQSAHTPAMGGLGAALARKSFAGGFGLEVDLRALPAPSATADFVLLYSESNSRFIVTIDPGNKESFEKLMTGVSCSEIGKVTDSGELRIRSLSGEIIIRENIHKLKREWQAPLRSKD